MDNIEFKERMYGLPYIEYCEVKQDIISKCVITSNVWKNWLNGRTAIPELAKPIIKEILDKRISVIRPQHRLQPTLNM